MDDWEAVEGQLPEALKLIQHERQECNFLWKFLGLLKFVPEEPPHQT